MKSAFEISRGGKKMSQRVHSCVNSTNMDTIHCDSYSSRLYDKKTASKPSRSASACSNKQQKFTKDSVVRRDLLADNEARIEVTMKTHKGSGGVGRSRSQSGGKETWGKALKMQNSGEDLSTFTHFDPLRTVHFLAQELQSKLKHSLPEDTGIQSMVKEIKQALSRVPPDMPSSANDQIPTKLKNNYKENHRPTDNRYTVDGTCQTPKGLYVEPEKLERHIVESSKKIENACQQMELLCTKLKQEKEELQCQLKVEKDAARLTNKQLDDERLKFHTTSALVDSLQTRNEQLERELTKLRVQLEQQQGPSAQELRTFIQELQAQKARSDDECAAVKQQLTVARMEAEKFETILLARDNQVKEIRNEMMQLQEVVNEQLMELQGQQFSSAASSVSNITGQFCS